MTGTPIFTCLDLCTIKRGLADGKTLKDLLLPVYADRVVFVRRFRDRSDGERGVDGISLSAREASHFDRVTYTEVQDYNWSRRIELISVNNVLDDDDLYEHLAKRMESILCYPTGFDLDTGDWCYHKGFPLPVDGYPGITSVDHQSPFPASKPRWFLSKFRLDMLKDWFLSRMQPFVLLSRDRTTTKTGCGSPGPVTHGYVMWPPEFTPEFCCDRALISMNGRFGYMDSTGRVVLDFVYDDAWTFEWSGRAQVKWQQEPLSFYIDPDGNRLPDKKDGNRLSDENWDGYLEIPNSKLAEIISAIRFFGGESPTFVCEILVGQGCLSKLAMDNAELVQEEIRQVIERCSMPNVAMPRDMCVADIIASSLYRSGVLSDRGVQLYEESPSGGPNKNPFSGIGEALKGKLVVCDIQDPETGLVSRGFQVIDATDAQSENVSGGP
ncbi:MAG: WG repeat-containing protein [Magnetococcales bacterium]|nr:WG repeat-containing protein [Magnetococcales bacterium]